MNKYYRGFYKLSTIKLSLLFFVLVFVCACSQVTPFEDRRREPGTEYIYVGSSKPGAPVICYNSLFYSKEEINLMANDLCATNDENTKAELVKTDSFSCRLLVPTKAYYKCVK